jgi:hypothetical protein
MAASGPGEFTRVISGSALRDLQGGSGAAPPPVAPAAGGAPAWPGMPAMPAISKPPMPAAAPHFAPPAFSFQPPAPPPAPAAPAAGGMPKWMLALLAVMGFLVIALLIILIFVLMRHK